MSNQDPNTSALGKLRQVALKVRRSLPRRSKWHTPGLFTEEAGIVNQELELKVIEESIFGNAPLDLEKLFELDTKDAAPLEPLPPDIGKSQKIYRGEIEGNADIESLLATPRHVVRFFVSSTFTDTVMERDCIVAFLVPRLRRLCQSRDLEFELSEMRWGINGTISETHQTRAVCMRELDRCLKDSAATSFVGIVGDKYGFRPIPSQCRELPKGEEGNEILRKWYRWDENIGQYLLSPVTQVYPEYNPNVNDSVSQQWWDDFQRIQEVFDRSLVHRGLPSVTQEEMKKGILDVVQTAQQDGRDLSPESGAPLLVLRSFNGDYEDSKYKDSAYAIPLGKLRSTLEDALPEQNIIRLKTKWYKGGINPVLHTEHGEYIASFLDALYKRLRAAILAFRPQSQDNLLAEVKTHWRFVYSRTERGHVRRENISQNLFEMAAAHPFSVLRGPSGIGKSTLLAELARHPPEVNGVRPCVIARFIPATVESSSVPGLVRGMCEQLQVLFPEVLEGEPIPSDPVDLVRAFRDTFLAAASSSTPVFVVIDALDQLRGSQSLGWLPRGSNMPSNVRVVVSTLEDSHFQGEPYPEMQLPLLGKKEAASQLLTALLSAQDPPRNLTAVQHEYVVEKFCSTKNPTFLYLRLLLDDAKLMHSFTEVPLPHWTSISDVPSAVDALFRRLRRSYGAVFVDKALAFITYARDGLTEAELGDLLSLDNDVLLSVFEWWVPPVPRIPPLMVTRLLEELSPYLTGQNVWFHRQFIESASLQFQAQREESFRKMISYWQGQTGSEHCIVTLKSGQQFRIASDRLVAPIRPYRKVRELPRALLEMNESEAFAELLCTFSFLLHGIQAGYMTDMMQQINRFKTVLAESTDVADHKEEQILNHELLNKELATAEIESRDAAGVASFKPKQVENPRQEKSSNIYQLGEEVDVIFKLLSLGGTALRRDPNELASQVLGRIPPSVSNPLLKKLREDAAQFRSKFPWWRPLGCSLETATTNALLRFVRCGSEVKSLAISQDGAVLATALRSGLIRFWDPATGQPLPGHEEPLVAHTRTINDIAFSPDGRTLASASSDRTVRLFVTTTGEPSPLQGGGVLRHVQWVSVVRFSPDGSYLVTGSADRRLRIFDAGTGSPRGGKLTLLARHTGLITAVAFHPDSKVFFSGGRDGLICMWRIPPNESDPVQLLGEPLMNSGWVNSLAVRPDGKMLAAGLRTRTVMLWDWEAAKPYSRADGANSEGTLVGHKSSVTCVAFSPDGSTLASGSNDRTVMLWDPDTQSLQDGRAEPLKGHTASVSCLAFGQGGLVVTGSPDESVRIWSSAGNGSKDAGGRTKKEAFNALGKGIHVGSVQSVAFSTDGKVIASSSRYGRIKFWNANDGAPVSEGLQSVSAGQSLICCVCYSPDGKYLASASWDKSIAFFEVSTGQLLQVVKGHSGIVTCIAFSSDSTLLASSSKDGSVRVWDVNSFEEKGKPLLGHAGWVNSVAFSPDDQYLASAADDGNVIVWDVATRTRKLGWEEKSMKHEGRVKCVTFSPNGSTLASCCSDGFVYLRDSENGRLLFPPIKSHKSSCNVIQFSPDGQTLVSGGADRNLRYIDPATGQFAPSQELPVRAHKLAVTDIKFSADGALMVTSSYDGRVRVWNTSSDSSSLSAQTVARHGSKVKSLAISKDKTIIASGSALGGIRLWNFNTGEQMHAQQGPMDGHELSIYSMDFSPDGTLLVSGSLDRTVRLWDVSSGTPAAPPLTGHTAYISSVKFSDDGLTITSVSSRETFVWDVRTFEIVDKGPGKGSSKSIKQGYASENPDLIAEGHLRSPVVGGTGFTIDSDAIDIALVQENSAVVFENGKPHFLALTGAD